MGNMKDSGIEWIGMIPEEWKISRIKYNTLIPISDGPHETPVFVEEGVPFYSVDGIQSEHLVYEPCRYISVEDADRYDKKIIPSYGDILMGKAASVGKIAIIDKHIRLQVWSPLAIIRSNEKQLHNLYLKYFLLSDSAQVEIDLNSTTNTQKNIAMEDIANLTVVIPTITEQQLIAEFLDDKVGKIDDILSDLRKQVETLQKYKKSVITKAVTKGLNPNVKMKDSGIDWIGEIPKSWDTTKRIKDIFNIGKGLSITKENLIEEGISVISYGQVHSKENTGTYIKPSFIRFVSDEYLKRNKNCLVHKGDFIFADTSEDVAGCGNCVYVDYEDTIFAGYHTIILSSDISDNRYLAYLFSTDVWRCQIREKVTAVKVYTISQKILKECKIILPSETEQQEIADYLDDKCAKIDELIKDKEAQIEKMEKYKKSLIYEYVTGKKRVKGAV
jgi:type I restriction enzyme S subunit